MTTARSALEQTAPIREGISEATVFGLDVVGDAVVPFLAGAQAAPTGRRLEMSVLDARSEVPSWPANAELVCDQRTPNGEVSYRIEAHPKVGYRLWGPGLGIHLLTDGGRQLSSFPEGGGDAPGWQRLLIAQVLPFACVLRGLEAFHAGAVVLDGSAVAFVGPSGAGKTSIVLELCRHGALFLADDVLALERRGGKLIGQVGSPLVGVAPAEAERLHSIDGVDVAHSFPVDASEQMVRVGGAVDGSPLGALFFLERRSDGPAKPRFEQSEGAGQLLTATFNFVVADPERLQRLLDVCALVADTRVERIVCGPGVQAADVATAVSERQRALA
jgi:hypothetical protein